MSNAQKNTLGTKNTDKSVAAWLFTIPPQATSVRLTVYAPTAGLAGYTPSPTSQKAGYP